MKKIFLSTLILFAAANVFASRTDFSPFDTNNFASNEGSQLKLAPNASFTTLGVNQDRFLPQSVINEKTQDEF